jgi:hypothetical protein
MWIRGGLEIDFALASGREARLVSSRTRSGAGRRYPVPRHATAKSGEKVEAVTERQALPCVR